MLNIKHALIYDGIGSEPFYADILTNGNKIERIAPNINVEAEIIDASGFVAAPGFVDVHRHLDFNVFTNPDFGTLELLQGITTALGGNCGLAPFPSSQSGRNEVYSFLQPVLGSSGGFAFESANQYFDALEKQALTINVGMLAATGAVRACVKGFSKAPYSEKELHAAQALLCETLQAGAAGISCGIMYTPECYTTADEFIRLLKPCAKFGRILTAHIRGEGNGLLASLAEVVEIAKGAGLALNISHFKAVGRKNWKNTIFKAIELIEKERASGLQLTADFYPFTGGATTLMSLLPPSFIQPSSAQTLARLESKQGRDELKHQLLKRRAGWDNMVMDIGWDRIIISGAAMNKNKRYCLKSVDECCKKYGFDSEVDFIADLLCEEQGCVSIIVMSMHEDDLAQIARLPYTALISDALYGAMETPHPRLYSSFPKFLTEFAINKKLLSVQQAVHKMTAMPAERFSMPEKGRLAAGADADINLFKLDEICAKASFESPAMLSSGIFQTIIGGATAINAGNIRRGLGSVIKV